MGLPEWYLDVTVRLLFRPFLPCLLSVAVDPFGSVRRCCHDLGSCNHSVCPGWIGPETAPFRFGPSMARHLFLALASATAGEELDETVLGCHRQVCPVAPDRPKSSSRLYLVHGTSVA